MSWTAFERFVNSELPRRISTDVPVSGNLPAGKFLQTTGIGLNVKIIDQIEGESVVEITQNNHGLNTLMPIYYDGTKWSPAIANSSETLATHVVIRVINENTFKMAMVGRYEMANHGLVPGEYYFTSHLYAGVLSRNEAPIYSNPIVFVESDSIVHILPYRPSITTQAENLESIKEEYFTQIFHVTNSIVTHRILKLSDTPIANSEIVKLNGLALDAIEDYNIIDDKIILSNELEIYPDDKISFKAKKLVIPVIVE